MARNMVETTTDLIINHIKNNIASALVSVSTDRVDNLVTMEPPKSYFTYEPIQGIRPPAILVIPEDINFRLGEKKANHINASIRLNVAVLVEDEKEPNVTIKSWRYQAALHQILNQTELTAHDNAVKIIILVENASFTAMYTTADNKDIPAGVYRQMAILECNVEHYESL